MDEITIGVSSGAAGGGIIGTLLTIGWFMLRAKRNGQPTSPTPPQPVTVQLPQEVVTAISSTHTNTELLKGGQTRQEAVLTKMHEQSIKDVEHKKSVLKEARSQTAILKRMEKKK